MTCIGNLLKKDLTLGIKDVYVLLELAFALVISLLLLFVVPKDIKTEAVVFIMDKTKIVENYIKEHVPNHEELMGEHYVAAREEIIEGMTENRSAIGLIISKKSEGPYQVELLKQPYTSKAMVDYIEMDLDDIFSIIAPPAPSYPPEILKSVRVETLKEGLRGEIPFNKSLLPPILTLMVGIIGLFAMNSLIGQERSDLTIRAYKVTPAGLWEFIISKHLVLLITGLGSFHILYLPMMGFHGYPEALIIMVLMILFGSSVGTILGSFFKDPMSAILWVFLIMLFLMLPTVSLFAPSFNPVWMNFIPTYHVLFSLDAAMFPGAGRALNLQGVLILSLIDAVLVPLSSGIFARVLRKEV